MAIYDIPDYEPHPYSQIFPLVPVTSKEFEQLSTDIAKHGMLTPAVIYQDKILDGYTRYRICKSIPEVEFITVPFKGNDTDALAFVLSANLRRRHLSETGRAMSACRWLFATGKENTKDNKTLAAEIFNSSVRMVEHAASIFEKGHKNLIEAVDNDSCKLSTAKKLLGFNNEQIDQALNSVDDRKELFAREKELDQEREFTNGVKKSLDGNSEEVLYGVIYTDYASGTELPVVQDHCAVFMWATSEQLYNAIDHLLDAGFPNGEVYNFIRLTDGKLASKKTTIEHLIVVTKGEPPLPNFQQNMVLNMKSGRPIQYAELITECYPTVPKLAMFQNQIKHKGDKWEYEPPIKEETPSKDRVAKPRKTKKDKETETTSETGTDQSVSTEQG